MSKFSVSLPDEAVSEIDEAAAAARSPSRPVNPSCIPLRTKVCAEVKPAK